MNIIPLAIRTTLSYADYTKPFLDTNGMLTVTPKGNTLTQAFLPSQPGFHAQTIGPAHDEWETLLPLAGRLAQGQSPFNEFNLDDIIKNIINVLVDKGTWRPSWQKLMDREFQFRKSAWFHKGSFGVLSDFGSLPWSTEIAQDCLAHDFMDWESPEWPEKREQCMFFFLPKTDTTGHGKIEEMKNLKASMDLFASIHGTPIVFQKPIMVGTLLQFSGPF